MTGWNGSGIHGPPLPFSSLPELPFTEKDSLTAILFFCMHGRGKNKAKILREIVGNIEILHVLELPFVQILPAFFTV